MGNFSIRQLDVNDLDGLTDLQRLVYSKHKPLTKIRANFYWKYFSNPSGTVVGSVACDKKGKIIGEYSGIPLRARLGKEDAVIYQVVGSSIDPAYRGQGIFRLLVNFYLQLLEKENTSKISFGFPNQVARNIGIPRLGYLPLRDIIYYRIPLLQLSVSNIATDDLSKKNTFSGLLNRSICFTFRRLFNERPYRHIVFDNNILIQEVEDVPPDIDDFWEKIKKANYNIITRDRQHLRWRLFQEPHTLTKVFCVRRNEEFIGYFALIPGINVRVVDFLCLPKYSMRVLLLKAMLHKASMTLDIATSDIDFSEEICLTSPKIIDISATTYSCHLKTPQTNKTTAENIYKWSLGPSERLMG